MTAWLAAAAAIAALAWVWRRSRRAMAELRDAVRLLSRLEQARRDFVADVSHEIRTPLASIKAYAETVNGGGLSDSERAEFLLEIERNADRMTKLADDLLTLSALDSAPAAASEPVSLDRVAAEVVAGMKPLAARKKQVIRMEPFHHLPPVRGHRGRLKQVLTNLIDNAVKYTPEGGTVRLSGAVSSGRVELVIEDNGVGIPAADLPRVFERFYRADKARSREHGGAGLGLSIVKAVSEAHGGSLEIEPRPEGGLEVTVRLPAAPAPAGSRARAGTDSPGRDPGAVRSPA